MKVENSDEISEDILIRQTLLGNKAAFEKLVLKYRPAIYTLVLSYVKNAADAEDLTQEVFIKAYQNLVCLKNLERFPFWLRRIAHNHCKNWLSRCGERYLFFDEIKVSESAKMAPSPEEMALKQELREIVWQAIDSLLEIDRKLLEARYMEDISLKQLQAEYGLSYPAIVNRLKRAKQEVRQQVQKLLGGFCALPGWEVIEKIFLGGIKAVKLSLKTKLVTIGVAVMLGLGGAGVWLWHSKPTPQKPSVIQQKVKPGKTLSTGVAGRVQIPKPTSKGVRVQPAKSSRSNQAEKISDEEWEQFEQWLAEPEQSDEQPAEEADLSQTQQDETASSALSEEAKAKYQALREVFVQMNETQREINSTADEWTHWMETATVPPPDEIPPNVDKKALKRKALKYFEGMYSYLQKLNDLSKEWLATAEQINQILPGALVTKYLEPPDGGMSDEKFTSPPTEYSINREFIESTLGKMPADVETAFLSLKSQTLRFPTTEEWERQKLRLEEMRELARK